MDKIYLGVPLNPEYWVMIAAKSRLTLTTAIAMPFVPSALVVEARCTTTEQANKLLVKEARIGKWVITSPHPYPWELFLENSPVFTEAQLDLLTVGDEVSIEFDNTSGTDPIELRAWLAGIEPKGLDPAV